MKGHYHNAIIRYTFNQLTSEFNSDYKKGRREDVGQYCSFFKKPNIKKAFWGKIFIE